MPVFSFRCDGPEPHAVRKIMKVYDPNTSLPCPHCKAALTRAPNPPTANVVETLDNGWMMKRVERPADAERLVGERARKANKPE